MVTRLFPLSYVPHLSIVPQGPRQKTNTTLKRHHCRNCETTILSLIFFTQWACLEKAICSCTELYCELLLKQSTVTEKPHTTSVPSNSHLTTDLITSFPVIVRPHKKTPESLYSSKACYLIKQKEYNRLFLLLFEDEVMPFSP